MTDNTKIHNWYTIPNIVSLLRIASVPEFLLLAWSQFLIKFLILFSDKIKMKKIMKHLFPSNIKYQYVK